MIWVQLPLAVRQLVPHLPDEAFEGYNVARHLVLVAVTHGEDAAAERDRHGSPELAEGLTKGEMSILGQVCRVLGHDFDGVLLGDGSLDVVELDFVFVLVDCGGRGEARYVLCLS
jgi:hypothetical protein